MKVRDMLPLQAERELPTLGEAIKVLNSFHPILNKKQFAESCGMTREQLYKYLPKTTKKESNKQTITPRLHPKMTEKPPNSAFESSVTCNHVTHQCLNLCRKTLRLHGYSYTHCRAKCLWALAKSLSVTQQKKRDFYEKWQAILSHLQQSE